MSKSNRLPILAEEIRRAHADARSALRQSLDKATEAGEALLEAKGLLPHGGWLPWLNQNCGLSERTAQRYMRLAKHKDEIAKSDTASDLTIRDALALLDTKSEIDRALHMEGEVEALRRELHRLSDRLDDATIAEIRTIIHRCDEIGGRAIEIRANSLRNIDRLTKELDATTGALRRELGDQDPWPALDNVMWTLHMSGELAP